MDRVASLLKYETAMALPVIGKKREHPMGIGIGGAYREELLALEGDWGARPVLQKNFHRVIEVEVRDLGFFVDVDKQEAYWKAREG